MCEHCDNCLRAKDSFEDLDVTLEAWKVLKVMNALQDSRFTFTQLADIVRGVKTDGVVLVDDDEPSGFVGPDKKIRLNLDTTCGGPALLNKDVSLADPSRRCTSFDAAVSFDDQQTETLVMQLYLEGYLDIGKHKSLSCPAML